MPAELKQMSTYLGCGMFGAAFIFAFSGAFLLAAIFGIAAVFFVVRGA